MAFGIGPQTYGMIGDHQPNGGIMAVQTMVYEQWLAQPHSQS
jgi:hypothetical protein